MGMARVGEGARRLRVLRPVRYPHPPAQPIRFSQLNPLSEEPSPRDLIVGRDHVFDALSSGRRGERFLDRFKREPAADYAFKLES